MKNVLQHCITPVGILALGIAVAGSAVGQPVYSDPPCPEGSGGQNPPPECNQYVEGGFFDSQPATCYNGCEAISTPEDQCCGTGPASCGALTYCGNFKSPKPKFKATKTIGQCVDGQCTNFGQPQQIGSLIEVNRYENGTNCDCGGSPTGCDYE